MGSTNNALLHRLTIADIDRLVEVIVDESGADLERARFTDTAMALLDQIPGLETLPSRAVRQYVSAMWTRYLSVQRATDSR
jgi:hypothetical protein